MRVLSLVLGFAGAAVAAGNPASALAWGDKGHEIIALIARQYLEPSVRSRVDELLADDPTTLVAHDMPAEATWADKVRGPADDDRGDVCRTCKWHFVNIEITQPDLTSACYGRQPLPPGTRASQGPATDCIVDKLEQFVAELCARDARREERRIALKYVLHLVGDLHQPLHVATNRDAGGNKRQVAAAEFPAGNLHFYWDVPLSRGWARTSMRSWRDLPPASHPSDKRGGPRGA